MADSVEVATGYVTLVASAKGIRDSIAEEMGSPLQQAGQRGGENLAEGVQAGSGGKMRAAGAFIGTALLAGLAVAIAGVGKLIADTIEHEAQAANLTARLGLSPSDTARMGKLAGEVYAENYGTGLDQVNDAIVRITQDIGDGTKEWTQQTTKDVLTVSNTFEQELGRTTAAVGTMIKTGLVKDTTEGLDLITRGIQVGADKAEDLLDTFIEYSVQFKNMGLDGKAAMGIISQGLQAGARNADVVADTIKEFSIEAVAGADRVRGGYKSLGMDADAMFKALAQGGPEAAKALDLTLDKLRAVEDPVKRNAIAIELFGTKAEDMGQALYALDPSAAVDTLGQVEGATKKVNDVISDTASNKIETLKRSIQHNLVEFMGNKVIPFFQDLGRRLDLSGILAAFQTFVTKAQEIWNMVLEDVRKFVEKHQARLQDLSTKAGTAFADLKFVIQNVLVAIKWLWDTFGEDLLGTALRTIEMIIGVVSGGLQHLKGIIQVISGIITGDWRLANEGLKNIVEGAFRAIWSIIDRIMGDIAAAIGVDWEGIKRKFADSIQWIRDKINWFSEMVGSVAGWMGEMKAAIERKWNEIRDFFGGIPQRIRDAIGNPGSILWGIGNAILQGLLDGLKSKWNEVTSFVKGIAPWIGANKGPLSYDRTLLTPAGHAIMDGLLAGLRDRESELQSYIGSISSRFGAVSGAEIGGLGDVSLRPNINVNVYGAEGQSSESVAEHAINKLVLKRRVV
jgi:phage-related protein